MTTDELIQTTCETALEFFGPTAQMMKATEELCELGVITAKIANGLLDPKGLPGHRTRLLDEMGDVALMMQQIMLNFHINDDEVEEVIVKKCKALLGRIERMKYINKHGVEA